MSLLYIKHLAQQNRSGRRQQILRKSTWLALGNTPELEIVHELDSLGKNLPKGFFLLNTLGKIVKSVEDKGISVKQYNKAVELLPNVNLPVESGDLPVTPNPHHSGTNAFITSLMSSTGAIDALNSMNITEDIDAIVELLKTGGVISNFTECVDCVSDVVSIIKESAGFEDPNAVLASTLQPIFEETKGLHTLGKLLDLLGIPQTGFIKTDLNNLADPKTKIALTLMRTGILNTLKEYRTNVSNMEYSLGDHSSKIENLKITVNKIKAILPTLEALRVVIENWDNTHVNVVKQLTS